MQLISVPDQPHVEDVCVHGVEQSPSELGGNDLGVETERRYFALTGHVQIITVIFERVYCRFRILAAEQSLMEYFHTFPNGLLTLNKIVNNKT